MATFINIKWIKILFSIFIATLVFSVSFNVHAQVADKVTTYKDENGWKLKVNGKDYYVKGVVWGYTPRGENYNYNLWAESDEFIKKVMDYEFSLMKKAGVNTIRSFTTIPPRWITYIYKKYGIMTALNPLMGRYGTTVDGVWKPYSDYSDPQTRKHLKQEVLQLVRKYKDTPGVLMFALGNESNYGLEWSSFEIENLPEGERHKEKAKYLYTLFNETIKEAKAIDSNHPFTIVNGDIQYIDLIRKYGTEFDLLGTNAYRGISFTDLWKEVERKLDLPVLIFEFGSDAFNAREFAEDQAAQASYLRGQWREMYNKSYGNGQEGNSVGGFVFEWRDEWWKYKQTERLEDHDRNASWANGGYKFDYVEGQNNMNEEWFGITALGQINNEGIYEAVPRMAYYVLSNIWKVDPYSKNRASINTAINNMDMEYLALKSEVQSLKNQNKERGAAYFAGGELRVEFIGNGFDNTLNDNDDADVNFTSGQMVFLDFEFQPTDKISGQTTINILGDVAERTMEFAYGDRGQPVVVTTPETTSGDFVLTTETVNPDRVEIYDFSSTYQGEGYDLHAFYHVPRYHWMYEGDFFGLLRETTDLTGPNGQDIWNAKAPNGVEFEGKNSADGLKVLFGPEVYWGANPKVMLKYEFGSGSTGYSFMHSEDIARKDSATGSTGATERLTSQTTLYSKTEFGPNTTLELGGIRANAERVGDKYTRQEGNNVVTDEIDPQDTLGARAKLSFGLFGSSQAYLAAHYAGLVADGGDPLREFGTQLPYSASGNKEELEGGVLFNFNTFTIFPRYLYRKNIVDANPFMPATTSGSTLNPGLAPRNADDDPFAVTDNREARSGEIIFTYDPTPATGFYEWDNDWREDAKFAFNLALTYTNYPTSTDSYQFFLEELDSNAAFGTGLPATDVWTASSKIVYRPYKQLKTITKLKAGEEQADGEAEGGLTRYYEIDTKFIIDKKHIISAYAKKDAWGLYDFYRTFNITYPYQYKLDYSILIDPLKDELRSSKIGVRLLYRTLDENSPDDEYQDGKNDYMFEIITYMTINF